MLDRSGARALAEEAIRKLNTGLDLVIRDDRTVERDFGWVFFYDSETFAKNKRIEDAIAGNSPIFVDRFRATTSFCVTHMPFDTYLKEYERKWRRPEGPCL